MVRKRKSSMTGTSREKRACTSEVGVKDMEKEVEEEEDEVSSSMGLSQFMSTAIAEEAEVGVIEKISMRNFMCHSRLEFKFGPKVNFIIGQNGSGKSAILTALVIGLGGKASITSRGSSVKGFIMHGKQSAEVVVKLQNRGADAFKHDSYGDSIIVERKLNGDGTSHYKLKSGQGRVVSQKREELTHMLGHLNIQVDNPMAILNQDTSRNFLHSKHATDKYKFFLKATQLEQMKTDYNEAMDSKRGAEHILKQKDETLPDLYKEVSNWEQKYKASLSLDELRKKIETLKKEMAWAIVYEKEKQLDSATFTKDLNIEQQRTPKFVQKVEEWQSNVAEKEEEQKARQEEVKSLSEQLATMEPQRTEADGARSDTKKVYRAKQLEHRTSKNELTSLQKDKQQILERIEEIKSSTQIDYEGERRAREERIAMLHTKLTELSQQVKTTEHTLSQFQAAVSKCKEDSYKLRSEEKDARHQVEQNKRHLMNLEASRANKLERFGAWIPQLQRRIDESMRAGRFHQRPRGPLGSHLNLREPHWALAIECCLQSLIHAFCVHDHRDEKELEGIFREVCPAGCKPAIITSYFAAHPHNVSKHRVHSDRYQTVQQMLKIDDHVVENCLIDQRGIETILLIMDSSEARKLMSTRPPQNCRQAFTKEGDQLHATPYRYYSTDMKNSRFLTASLEDDIIACREELKRCEAEATTVVANLQQNLTQVRTHQQEENRCGVHLAKLNDSISRIKFEVTELENVEDPAPVDVTTLEEEVERKEAQITRISERHAACDASLTASQEAHQAAETQFQSIDQAMRQIADRSDPINEQLGRIEDELRKAKSLKQHYEKKKKEHDKKIAEMQSMVDTKQKDIQESVVKAETICERIRTRRTSQNINGEINQIRMRIKKEEENRGNHEEIQRRYHEVLTSYKKIKHEVSQLKNFLTMLGQVMASRKDQYHTFRGMIALRTKSYFMLMLHNRNYRGNMNFNHQTENLVLSVQPQHMQNDGSKDMKALSGGERSFTTVCFILALWEAMESPFRCLDEFDVFMDMVNRRISMDMMMKVADEQRGRQFIFLTPLDMSQLHVKRGMRIFEMPPPQRDQSVLPFSQQGERSNKDDNEGDNA